MRILGRSGKPGEPDWRAHEAVAGRLAAMVPRCRGMTEYWGRPASAPWLADVLAGPPEAAPALVMLLLRQAAADGGWSHHTCQDVRELLRRRPFTLPVADAVYALRAASRLPDEWPVHEVIAVATSTAARSRDRADPGLVEAARVLTANLASRRNLPAEGLSKARMNLALLRPGPAANQAVDISHVVAGDGWSAAVSARLAGRSDATGRQNALLGRLMSARGSKPAQSWLAAASDVLADPGAREVLRALVECAASAEPAIMDLRYGLQAETVVGDANVDLVRAACWATISTAEDWAIPALTSIARRQRYMASAKVPNAAFYALGQIATPDAITALQDLQRAIKHAGYRKQIAAAVTAAAQRAGLSPGQLTERVVATGGLSTSGERLVTTGGRAARITVSKEWRAQTEWQAAGGWTRKPPADVSAESAQAVRWPPSGPAWRACSPRTAAGTSASGACGTWTARSPALCRAA